MRRSFLALLMVAVFVIPAIAGQNPDIRCYVDYDPPNYVHRADPTIGVPTEAYIVLDGFGSCDPGVGMTAISIKITPDAGIASFIIYECLLTDCLAIGAWENGTTVSATECMVCDGSTGPEYPGIVLVAKMTIFPTGVAGDILIEDHPDFPRWVVDCQTPVPEVDLYCVLYHGALYKDAVQGDCQISAVEESSWGTIKSLYR